MSLRLVLAAALVAGCYAPSANPGAPCSPSGLCPGGQECRSGVCFATGAPHDGDVTADDGPPDVPPTDAAIDAIPYVPWGAPEELSSLESSGSGETDPSITADKLTVVFTAEVAANDDDLFIATRAALTDSFAITPLTELNAAGFDDKSADISPDGLTIFFASDRAGEYDIYQSTFSTMWSTPVLRADLSTTSDDSDVAISPDGLTAVVLRNSSPNVFAIHTRADLGADFGTGATHPELSITADVAAPTITNGADVIYFHAGGERQLHGATRTANGTYTTPLPVTELNVAGVRCAAPFVLQSNDYMIFDRSSDIWQSSRTLPAM